MTVSRSCVYTCLIGNAEELNEQPAAKGSRTPFICFTDNPALRSETWEIRQVSTLFGLDFVRNHRLFKLRPHEHLPDFDLSLYIDNSVVLAQPPEVLIEHHPPTSGFCLPAHSFRDSVLDEFLEVAALGLDDSGRVFEQLNHYTVECPEVLQEKPYWTAILLRDHRSASVRAMLDVWCAHVLRYSRRDQLSVNMAFRRAGLTPDVMRIDNYTSDYHTWPTKQRGDFGVGVPRPANSSGPPSFRIRELEVALVHAKRQTSGARAEADHHEHTVAERNREIAALRSEVTHRERTLAARDEEIGALHAAVNYQEQTLAARDEEIAALHAAVNYQEQTIAARDEEIAALHVAANCQEQTLVAREQEIAGHHAAAAALHETLVRAQAEQETLAAARAEQQTRVHQCEQALASAGQAEKALVDERERTKQLLASLALTQQTLAAEQQRVAALLASTSWRMTAPVRGLVRRLKGPSGPA